MGYLLITPMVVGLTVIPFLMSTLVMYLHWRRSFTVQLLASSILSITATILVTFVFNELPQSRFVPMCISSGVFVEMFINGLYGAALSCYIEWMIILSSTTFIDQRSFKMKVLKFLYFSLTYLLPALLATVQILVYNIPEYGATITAPKGMVLCLNRGAFLTATNNLIKSVYTFLGSIFLAITITRFRTRILSTFKGVDHRKGTSSTTSAGVRSRATSSASRSSAGGGGGGGGATSQNNYQRNLMIRLGFFCIAHCCLAVPAMIWIIVVNERDYSNFYRLFTGQSTEPPNVVNVDGATAKRIIAQLNGQALVLLFLVVGASFAMFGVFGTGKSVKDRYDRLFLSSRKFIWQYLPRQLTNASVKSALSSMITSVTTSVVGARTPDSKSGGKKKKRKRAATNQGAARKGDKGVTGKSAANTITSAARNVAGNTASSLTEVASTTPVSGSAPSSTSTAPVKRPSESFQPKRPIATSRLESDLFDDDEKNKKAESKLASAVPTAKANMTSPAADADGVTAANAAAPSAVATAAAAAASDNTENIAIDIPEPGISEANIDSPASPTTARPSEASEAPLL